MASGDTKTEHLLDVLANGSRADIPADNCCNTKTQNYILGAVNRMVSLEEEVEELQNNPDVTDIVSTYQDLTNYDKTTLTGGDVIRVLTDSTHDDESAYYRYNASTDSFDYIGTTRAYTDFVGTSGGMAGASGLVPAPQATDVDKYLKSDGTWATVSGGGGGTTNYNSVTNKPRVNNVTLQGNKTLSELGIQPAGNYLTTETDPVFSASPSAGITSSDITSWDNKQAALVSGTNIKTINNQSILGSGNITIEGGEPNYEDPVLSNSAFEITDEDDNVLFAVSNTGAIKTKTFDSDDLNGGQEYDIDYVLRNGEWGSGALTWYPNIVCNSVRIKGPFKIATSSGYVLYSAYSYTNKLDTDFTGATKVLEEDTARTSWSYAGNDYVGFNLISSEGVGSNLTILEPLYSAIAMLKSPDIKENIKKDHKTKAIRNAIFLGDSITHGVYSYYNNGVHTNANRYCAWYWNRTYKTMPDYFSEYSGACVNNAAGRGSGYVIEGRYSASGNNVSGQGPFYGNTNRKKETYNFANYDFVGVMEGINDYIQQASLGTFPTSGNPVSGTVTGNLALLIQKVISDNPLCKIVIYSPYNAWGQVAKGDSTKGGYVANETYGDFAGDYALGYTKRTYTLSDLVEAIDKVCKYYHIEHVKLSESNICNRLSIKDIMIEGLHSSLESMPKLAAEIFADKGYGE